MLPELQAERQLLAIEAATAPHMEKNAFRDVVRNHSRVAAVAARPRPASDADLAALGIQVEYVKAVE